MRFSTKKKSFLAEKISFAQKNIFWPKKSLAEKIWPKNSLAEKFFGRKKFWPKNSLAEKSFGRK